MVEFEIELILRAVGESVFAKVEELAGQIGLGIEINDGLPDGIDFVLGNYVPGDLRSGRAIGAAADGVINRIHRSGKIACPLVGRSERPIHRYAGYDVNGFVVSDLLQIEKEEGAVLPDRSTHGETILVARVQRLDAGLRIEEIAGIGARALEEPPTAAVECVGSASQNHVYDGPAVVAELRGKAIVLDLELLNDLDRGLVINVAGSAFPLLRRADQRAVDADVGGRIALTIGNEVGAFGIVVLGAGPGHFGHSAGQKCKPEEAAVQKRKVFHVLVGDIGAQRRALGIQQWSGHGDHDLLADTRRSHSKIQ